MKDMMKIERLLIEGFINHAIIVSSKFIDKVDSGRARSIETYRELKEIKEEAELIKERIFEVKR